MEPAKNLLDGLLSLLNEEELIRLHKRALLRGQDKLADALSVEIIWKRGKKQ